MDVYVEGLRASLPSSRSRDAGEVQAPKCVTNGCIWRRNELRDRIYHHFVTIMLKYGVPIATLIFFVFYLLYVLASIVLDDLAHPTVPLTNGYQPLSTTINDYLNRPPAYS